MLINFVPVTQGMTTEEVRQALALGWVHIGRQAIQGQQLIVDPSKPLGGGVQDVDVWILPEPTIPVVVVANALVDAGKQPDILVYLAQQLLGASYEDVRTKVLAARKKVTDLPA